MGLQKDLRSLKQDLILHQELIIQLTDLLCSPEPKIKIEETLAPLFVYETYIYK